MGDFLDIKGPKGQMKYTPDLANEIGMIAGGTGITPMLVSELTAKARKPDPIYVSRSVPARIDDLFDTQLTF